jgi:hypothetical protein
MFTAFKSSVDARDYTTTEPDLNYKDRRPCQRFDSLGYNNAVAEERRIREHAQAIQLAGMALAAARSTKATTPARIFAGRKSLSELSMQAAESVPDLVAGYLPSVGYNIMIGESGLGKSPLLVQLGICVAMGLPFLRMPTTRAKVLMVDYENHTQLDGMISTICKFLGADRSELRKSLEVLDEGDAAHVIAQAKDYGAGLILVDALRGLSSQAESKNDAASDLIGQLNELKACKLVLHHPRKADRKAPPPALEADDTNLMMWLQEAAGARALINQASTRIAVDGCRHADLLLRAHYKVKGEVPRVYVSRIVDEWGEPVGYAAAEGEQLLSLNQRSWFRQVQGQTIPFANLQGLLRSTSGRPVAQFVQDCQQAGIARVTGTAKSKTDPRKVTFLEIRASDASDDPATHHLQE